MLNRNEIERRTETAQTNVNNSLIRERKKKWLLKLWRHFIIVINVQVPFLSSWCAVCTEWMQAHISFVWFPSLFQSQKKEKYLNYVQFTCSIGENRALQSVWRNVICVQSAAWRMRNGHFTVSTHAKLKIVMSRVQIASNRKRGSGRARLQANSFIYTLTQHD